LLNGFNRAQFCQFCEKGLFPPPTLQCSSKPWVYISHLLGQINALPHWEPICSFHRTVLNVMPKVEVFGLTPCYQLSVAGSSSLDGPPSPPQSPEEYSSRLLFFRVVSPGALPLPRGLLDPSRNRRFLCSASTYVFRQATRDIRVTVLSPNPAAGVVRPRGSPHSSLDPFLSQVHPQGETLETSLPPRQHSLQCPLFQR